ncbi:hypothetical protein QQ045_022790 [Rhodiola kirilowii]
MKITGNNVGRSNNANAASGMAVNDECKLKFLELKAKRTHRFIVFKIDEKVQQTLTKTCCCEVEEQDDPATTVLTRHTTISQLACPTTSVVILSIILISSPVRTARRARSSSVSWSPDTSRVRSKMLYASSKDRFKRELDGIQFELQATDPTELSLDLVKSRAV